MPHVRKLLSNLRQRPWHALLAFGALTLLGLGVGIPVLYAYSQYQLGAAQQALERYDLSAARQHLEQSLSTWPRNTHAQFLAARIARRRDAYAEAERLLMAYEQRQGVTPESDLEWILLGVQQGDFAGQERSLLSLVDREYAGTPLILEALAKGYQSTLRGSDMLACLDRLLQQQPADVPALVLRGKGYEGLRNPEKALENYQQALELLPESDEARLGLAEMLNRLGRPREAMYHYEVLRQRQPANPTVLLGLARCRFDACDLDQTGQLLDTLLAGQPDHVGGLVEWARLEIRLGQTAAAEKRLTQAVTLAPWHREAQRWLLLCRQTLVALAISYATNSDHGYAGDSPGS